MLTLIRISGVVVDIYARFDVIVSISCIICTSEPSQINGSTQSVQGSQ